MVSGTDTNQTRWYIIHTYSGQEERVKKNLDLRIQSLDMQDRIFQVVVPQKRRSSSRTARGAPNARRCSPDYILVQMSLDDESWYVVRNTPGVTGFVSTEDETDKRPKPIPLEDSEVDAILNQIESGPTKVSVGFQKGQMVRISAGPFADFIGAVNEIDANKGKVWVLVSFFGRETPVELDFLQVEKI